MGNCFVTIVIATNKQTSKFLSSILPHCRILIPHLHDNDNEQLPPHTTVNTNTKCGMNGARGATHIEPQVCFSLFLLLFYYINFVCVVFTYECHHRALPSTLTPKPGWMGLDAMCDECHHHALPSTPTPKPGWMGLDARHASRPRYVFLSFYCYFINYLYIQSLPMNATGMGWCDLPFTWPDRQIP
jgi:hypothetical protein